MLKRAPAIVRLASLMLLCPAVVAAGVVSGISVAPATPTINQSATVTITGQSPCGAVEIDFGDGMKQIFTPPSGLPFSTPHTWATTGAKTITAKGHGTNCSGQATKTINVNSEIFVDIGNLCKVIDCTPTPVITTLFGFNRPGGILAIIGKSFGTKTGSVAAVLKKFNGQDLKKTLTVNVWKNTLIEVQWPDDITGVMQHDATLRVTTSQNETSAPRTLSFTPDEDFKVLPFGDVKVLSCGTDGNADSCNGQIDPDDEGHFFSVSSDSIDGYHYNVWAAIGDDTGTDVYQIALKNQWEMQSFNWKVSVDKGEGWATQPSGFGTVANWSPSVKWLVTPNDGLTYIGVITIGGPVGVPHK